MTFKTYRILLASLLLIAASLSVNAQQIKAFLLKDVDSLSLPQPPDQNTAFFIIGAQPEIIAIQEAMDWTGSPFKITGITASTLGNGKIVGLGGRSFFRDDRLQDKNIAQLMNNIIDWAKNGKSNLNAAIIGTPETGIKEFLTRQNIPVHEKNTLDLKAGTNLLFVNRDVRDDAELKQLETFVTQGGTLVFASPFPDYNTGKAGSQYAVYEDLKINTLLAKAGITNVNIWLTPSSAQAQFWLGEAPYYLKFDTLLPALGRGEEMGAGVKVLSDLAVTEVLRHNDYKSLIVGQIKRVYGVPADLPLPSPEKPVVNNTPELKRSNKMAYQLYNKQQDFAFHPNAKAIGYETFPGAVPATALRVTQKLIIPLHVGSQGYTDNLNNVQSRLHPTGLYIPAGEKVTIVINGADVNRHLAARIGMHNDDVTNLDQFTRSPLSLIKDVTLQKKETEVYSQYGGLLLIAAPDTSTLKQVTVTVKGAVKAPYFKLGKTNEKEWKASIRNNPAPWAQLATNNIVLTVPSARIRKLDNPTKLMQFWDEVLNADAELAAMPKKRKHWEHIVVDNDVAFGYMFTTLDKITVPNDQSCAWMLDESHMRASGSWGTLHELGHRHQYWPFEDGGTQEVTVNLYTTYVYDRVLHKGVYQHEGMQSHAEMLSKIKKYLSSSTLGYNDWRRDPFLALAMYLELVEEFGWDAIKKVNTTYRETPKDQFPRNDAQKLDFRFLTLCKATNSNLSRFFEVWKIPVSATAKKQAESYKEWFPEELAAYK